MEELTVVTYGMVNEFAKHVDDFFHEYHSSVTCGGRKEDHLRDYVGLSACLMEKLGKAVGVCAQIIQQHQKWLTRVSLGFRLVGFSKEGMLIFSSGDQRIEFAYDTSRHRWLFGAGPSGSSADVLELSGVSGEYLSGIEDAMTLLAEPCAADLIWRNIKGKFRDEFRKMGLEKHSLLSNETLLREFVDAGSIQAVCNRVSEFARARSVAAANRQISRLCQIYKMPSPPPAKCFAKDAALVRSSGVYFAWVGGVCVYVGKSRSIGKRLLSHNLVDRHDDVSWVEFDKKEMHHSELFYIWLLKPERNGETRKCLDK